MKHPKQISEQIGKSMGKKPTVAHHLQHSSIDTMHTWATHSVHESAEAARKMWKVAVTKFPTHYKWRIQHIKLVKD